MRKLSKIASVISLSFFLVLFNFSAAFAGDGATLLFREGQMAYISNGYSQLVEAYKKLNKESSSHNIVELKIESSPFLINLAEVVLICRDRCTSLEVVDPRRGSEAKSKVSVNNNR